MAHGIGKSEKEMRRALEVGIQCFNVESEGELERLSRMASQAGKTASVSFRVNPDVDPKTHPYIATGLRENKFGVPFDEALPLYRKAAGLASIRVVGIDVHIGSQLTEIEPFVTALDKILALADSLSREGIRVSHLDVGGGLGIRYRDENPPSMKEYAGRLIQRVGTRSLKILFEPGRALVGNAGVLLTRIEYLKNGAVKNFAIVDAAMNDLMRPALYDSWHDVLPVRRKSGAPRVYDVVGPVCESGDFLARDRELAASPGDLLAIMSAGAYGMSMSSNYNSRPRATEVMVDGATAHVVRAGEPIPALFASERILP